MDKFRIALMSEEEGLNILDVLINEFGGIKKEIPNSVKGIIGCNGLESVGIQKDADKFYLSISNTFLYRGEAIMDYVKDYLFEKR